MAISATTEWDVRTTGNDGNGGGFDTSSSGTDYSQQNSPQVTYTDLVIDATTNTKLTSATTPFTAAHVGNIINITSGTGFTVQRVQIVSVTSSVATCDKSCGTTSSTGGNGKLGGSLLTVNATSSPAVDGNTVWIQSGTYSGTVTNGVANGVPQLFSYIGYAATHGDNGTRPLITTNANSILFALNGNLAYLIKNINFSSTASTRNDCLNPNGTTLLTAINCTFDGFRYASFGDNGARGYFSYAHYAGVEVKNSTTGGILSVGTISAYGCNIHDNTGAGIQAPTVTVVRCLLTDNTTGINQTSGTAHIQECTIANNSSSGVINSSATQVWAYVVNCIIYGNGAYGISYGSANTSNVSLFALINNAFGANTSGAGNNLRSGAGTVTLTVDPFTSAGTGDYSLNNTAGGGAACRGAGFQFGS